jgi:hypothetical protein
MSLDWYDVADPDDVRAHELYSSLIDAKLEGRHGWEDTWVKVPRKAVHHISSPSTSGEPEYLWNGLRWVQVFTYETRGRLYVRLPQHGESE